ncbi:hypothetical protein [Sphingobium bisphenolivorans]|uniref:hypothetical protein n=1 Tax=Sphingobium bisphenolivorans TaxID=1335760 RepID=UPI00039AD712|nr:hypothetical protein [Sphingobium bisphenolivorans]
MRCWPLTLLLLAGCGDGGRADDAHRSLKTPIRYAPADTPPTVSAPADIPAAAGFENQAEAAPEPKPSATPAPVKQTASLPAAASDNSYYAIGTEPFWAVTVRGSSASIDRADKEPARVIVSRAEEDGNVRYNGEGFTMTVTPGPCSDGMSDAVWSDRVTISFGDNVVKGCGGRRDDPGG